MSERKVLNKYYPPDFDPSKIPKLKLPKNRQYSIRIMAPFNMRCETCGEYIYKGKKFNSRKETVEDETYLGLYIFRFYIKCPRCVAEIAFKTDPERTDYALEAGATRNFEPTRTAEELAEKERKEKEEEEKNNPMKVLENRTKASRQEMDMMETLEELKELNSRHAKVDHESMIKVYRAYEEQLRKLQEDEDEEFIRSMFGKTENGSMKRLVDDVDEDEVHTSEGSKKKIFKSDKPTDVLTKDSGISSSNIEKPTASWQRSVGGLSTSKSLLKGLVKRKPASTANTVVSLPIAEKTEKREKSLEEKTESKTETGREASKATAAPTGLGLLGNYSDSSNDDSS